MLSAVCLVGCRTTWREEETITSPTGQRLCAKHKVPLIAVRGFEPPRGVFTHDNMNRPFYNIVGEHSPNHIPDYQTTRRSDLQRVPVTIRYCPLCEQELVDGLRVSDEKVAIKFAEYALPIYGGGGHATKGPYQVSLHNGIWTVTCFLVDGRHAMIKISKERGSVETTKYWK